VATYEYRCLECDERFEARRPMASADQATCPSGHDRVKRLLSSFASTRGGVAASIPMGGGGGCCGGACGCG
jgi:putative FmdB family regulatory protein